MHPRQDVLINGHRERRRGVPKTLADAFEWNAGFQQQRRMGMAEIVEINDEMIAAERRYIAAASVTELTNEPAELASPTAPEPDQQLRETHVAYTTRRDAIESRGASANQTGRLWLRFSGMAQPGR